VTLNGPAGNSINPNQFPVSGVAIDTSDLTGNTAYVTVMGFTGGPGHVWQTTNAGASWTDFSGTGTNAIPDSPANAVVVDSVAHVAYVGTDVGVFQSSTLAIAWTEVGLIPSPTSTGFLPDVAVTALALFNSGGQKFLRASTYGRGIWQFSLPVAPDFIIAVSNTPQTIFPGQQASFNGTLTAVNGYSNPVELSCIGSSLPSSPCVLNPPVLTPASAGATFTLTTSSNTVTSYNFDVEGIGSDPNNTTHAAALTLNVVNLSLSTPTPTTVTVPRGTTSPPVSFQLTAQGAFTQGVTLSCSFVPSIAGATCAFTPGATVFPTSASPLNMTATVSVPAATSVGNYTVTLQGTTGPAPTPLSASYVLAVALNPDFVLTGPATFRTVNAGSTTANGSVEITATDGFNSPVSLTCSLSTTNGSCSETPSPVTSFPTFVGITVNAIGLVAGSDQFTVTGTSSTRTHTVVVPFNVADYQLSGPASITLPPNGQDIAILTITPSAFYTGTVNISCTTGSLGGQCPVKPSSTPVTAGTNVSVTSTINVPSNAVPGVLALQCRSHLRFAFYFVCSRAAVEEAMAAVATATPEAACKAAHLPEPTPST